MLFGDFTLTTTMVTTATIYICQEGTNSPAATPEIVDLELDSAQFLQVGEPDEEKVKVKTVTVEETDKENNEASDEIEDEEDI
jgi:hypothetical protein